jgi:hypothetical protein
MNVCLDTWIALFAAASTKDVTDSKYNATKLGPKKSAAEPEALLSLRRC